MSGSILPLLDEAGPVTGAELAYVVQNGMNRRITLDAISNFRQTHSGSFQDILLSGASGDGVTNDQPAIQTWLNGLPSGSGVIVPSGRYFYLASTLSVPRSITIQGMAQPFQMPNDGNWGYGSGFILSAAATFSMYPSSSLWMMMIKRSGLIASPTASQCVAEIAAWGGEASVGITIPPNYGGVILSDLMLVGFNTGIKASAGNFTIKNVHGDCYNGVEVTTAGDNHTVENVRFEPFRAIATNAAQGGWARPGTAFNFHDGNTGLNAINCFSFMYKTFVKLKDVGVSTFTGCEGEWINDYGNGATGSEGILATGHNTGIEFNSCFISQFECPYDIQSTGDVQINGGQASSSGSTGIIKISGGAGSSGSVTGTVLYSFGSATAPCVVIGSGITGDNERWKFTGVRPQGNTTAASWINIDASSVNGVDLLNVRGTLYTASGYLGSQTTVQSRINEKLHIRTDPSVATVDGASNAPLTAESLQTGTGASRVQNFWRLGTLIGSVKTMPSGGTQGGMMIFGTDFTNGSVALTPNGTGAIMADIPDGLAAGGNVRGIYAVDWQVDRAAASQVASGPYAAILYGKNNTASGLKALAGGDGTSVSGDTGMALGFSHVSTGDRSAIFGGANGGDGGRAGVRVWAQDPAGIPGNRQFADTAWGAISIDATPTRITAYGAAGAANVYNINSNARAFMMDIKVIAERADVQDIKTWRYDSAILSRQTGAASTLLTLPAAVNTTQGAPGAWAVSITADTTNAGLNVTVTGAAGVSIRWTVSIVSTETG